MNWYDIKNINSIDSPALIIYKERVQQNIDALIQMKDVAHLRPHVKTNKMAEVCLMMLKEGITRFKCATIAEAEMLAIIKAPDVLLAYQPTPAKAKRLLQLAQKFPVTHFSCLIDDVVNAENIALIFAENNLVLNVYIDLNVGQNRTGIKSENALDLFNECENFKSVNVIGLHAYDGHIRDSNPDQRKLNADEAFQKVVQLADAIESSSNKKLNIVAGGSPTFPVHAQRQNIECSPGTFVFWDYSYKTQFPDEPFNYAALVITRIISIVDEHTICIDLGHKSVASENTIDKRIHFLNTLNAQPISQSEEHLVLKVDDASIYKIGGVLFGIPYHICPTVALYERASIIKNNEVVDEWKVIARDKKLSV